MTLVQLRHLIALAETGSFSRSAQRLFITQPALSRSIRALEDELGQPLFDRIGRRSELTPFGREQVARAQQLVSDADEMLGSGQQMATGQAGTLRIGMGSGPGAMLMTPLLMRMATRHPRVRVDISRARTELLVQALRERALDALVVDARSMSPAPDLSVDSLHEMRGSFMCRRGHPLTRKRGSVGFADVQRYPIASTPLSDEVARVLVERFGSQAHPRAVRDPALRGGRQPRRGGAAHGRGTAGDPRGRPGARRVADETRLEFDRALRPRDARPSHPGSGPGDRSRADGRADARLNKPMHCAGIGLCHFRLFPASPRP